MQVCRCGCGLISTENSEYAKGHWNRDKQIRDKIRASVLKKYDKDCICGCGKKSNTKSGYSVGHWNRGSRRTTESKLKMSKIRSARLKSGDIQTWNKGMTKKNAPQMSNSGVKKGNVPYMKGKKHTAEAKIKNSISQKKNWSDLNSTYNSKEYREKLERVQTRRSNTSIEIKVKKYLKTLNVNFYQSYWISNIQHKYCADFFIKPNIVVECDGDYWHNYPKGKDIDHIRTKELQQAGYKVLRFWGSTIRNNFKDVKEKINEVI